jgi:arylsulfatase A-like enzyme
MKILLLFILIGAAALRSGAAAEGKPNVLMIVIDDMRAWAGYLGETQAKTPNLDRLAKSGVAFTRSYSAYALCNPSRTATLTGLRPDTTGVMSNNNDWRDAVPADRPSLPGYLHTQGWRTMTAGKVFHGGKLRREDWDEFLKDNQREEKDNDKQDWSLKPGKSPDGFVIGSNEIQPVDSPEEDLVDYQTASYGVTQLGRKFDHPFFLACGFHRPHLPWTAPRKYFDLFPLESIKLPEVKADDLADVPGEGRKVAKPGEFAAVRDLGKWRECVRAYLACIAYTDAQVGRLLDALDKSPHRDNTVVVLWSDHGWHHGEKEHWRKQTLWEEATRAPLLWRVPGVTRPGGVCERTVDFMSIYPTLCDVCGIAAPPHLEGPSIRPLLADPNAAWERPAISAFKPGSHAVRSERWRYIRYADGGEELYDHDADPNEWTNLANKPEHAALKAGLARWLPGESQGAPGAQGKKNKPEKKKGKPAAASS